MSELLTWLYEALRRRPKHRRRRALVSYGALVIRHSKPTPQPPQPPKPPLQPKPADPLMPLRGA